MLNTKLKLTLGLAALAATTALAQTPTNSPATGAISATPAMATAAKPVAASSAATPPTGFDQWANEVKNPVGWLTWGGDIRVRNEYFNDALSLTTDPALRPFAPLHEQEYFRFRGRVWASFFPTNDLTLNFRLSAEPREFLKPSTMDSYLNQLGMQWRYGIVDT